ncbi:RHS repeat-associated core domain protein [Saprospira grandis DSM 2844]|uniref:Lysozyme n=1 Tax=Saprospira grandis DSM 2844 TaxID=694433 RepID=J0P3S2_9BACT|nr:RHS repeat-associated core domain protein [Saprospira grandis DSM 2844]
MYLEELHLYGSARLGILKKALALRYRDESGTANWSIRTLAKTALAQSSYQQLELGRRRYELSNHLGNVLATLSDKSLGQDSSQTGQADYYLAQVSSANLYYPFGWEMPGRKFVSGEGYRFGFNGQEEDPDMGVVFKYRIHDARVGRFLSVDPLAPDYPWNSCYAFAENRVIDGIDLEGREWLPVNKNGDPVKPDSDEIENYEWIGYDIKGYERGGKVYAESNPHSLDQENVIRESPAGTVQNAFIRKYENEKYIEKVVYNSDGCVEKHKTKLFGEFSLSDAGASAIASGEQYISLPKNVGGYAVGYGLQIDYGATWTFGEVSKELAISWLFDAARINKGLLNGKFGKLRMTQHEYDAIISLSYNFGVGSLSEKSTFIDLVQKNDAIASEIHNGFVSLSLGSRYEKGLVPRRKAEAEMYNFGIYDYGDIPQMIKRSSVLKNFPKPKELVIY